MGGGENKFFARTLVGIEKKAYLCTRFCKNMQNPQKNEY